jgi:hypothetical protein
MSASTFFPEGTEVRPTDDANRSILKAASRIISGFSPASIPGLTAWFKGEQLVAQGLADTDPIATWQDSSGNGNHITQAVAADRPVLRTSILNGHPVGRFDATDFLQGVAFTGGDLVQPNTIIGVVKFADTATRCAWDGIESTKRNMLYIEGSSPGFVAYAGVDTTLNWAASGRETEWNYILIEYNGANSVFRSNGVDRETNNAGNHALSGITMGRFAAPNVAVNGDIAELMVFSGLLSADNKTAIENYIRTKYGLA